jgi:hypothetical protein
LDEALSINDLTVKTPLNAPVAIWRRMMVVMLVAMDEIERLRVESASRARAVVAVIAAPREQLRHM